MSNLNKIVVPKMDAWEAAAENTKGFVSKFLHEETGALFAIRKVGRGHYLMVAPSGNGKFEPVSPVTSSNLTEMVVTAIRTKLTGPVCGSEQDPTYSAEEPKGCLGTGVFYKANGEEGDCFRCKRKGYVNADDTKRNKAYDAKAAKRRNTTIDMGDATL
jgi:hypothetical protein